MSLVVEKKVGQKFKSHIPLRRRFAANPQRRVQLNRVVKPAIQKPGNSKSGVVKQ